MLHASPEVRKWEIPLLVSRLELVKRLNSLLYEIAVARKSDEAKESQSEDQAEITIEIVFPYCDCEKSEGGKKITLGITSKKACDSRVTYRGNSVGSDSLISLIIPFFFLLLQ